VEFTRDIWNFRRDIQRPRPLVSALAEVQGGKRRGDIRRGAFGIDTAGDNHSHCHLGNRVLDDSVRLARIGRSRNRVTFRCYTR
jgi:hypothetical protein